ncbi:MAG: DUF3343 domain-containing protein [Bacillota bacterium]|nr:DUF3343 domain-containing protein [Bacillota bacterium]
MARRDESYLLYTFKSPHVTIKSQKVMEGLQTKIIPVLREISESCGMALKVNLTDLDASLERIRASEIAAWNLYRIEIVSGELNLTLLEKKE